MLYFLLFFYSKCCGCQMNVTIPSLGENRICFLITSTAINRLKPTEIHAVYTKVRIDRHCVQHYVTIFFQTDQGFAFVV